MGEQIDEEIMTDTTTRTSSKVKLVDEPPVFDGTKSEYEAWKRKIRLYHYAYKKDFAEDEPQILHALSYMKGGTAGTYADDFVEQALEQDSFGTKAEFWRKTDELFKDTQEEFTNQTKFTTLAMGTMSAEEYFQKFDQYRKKCKYTQGKDYCNCTGVWNGCLLHRASREECPYEPGRKNDKLRHSD